MTTTIALFGALIGAQAAAAVAPAADADLARVDALWARRDDPTALGEARALLERRLAGAPGHGVLWRGARLYFWLADDPAASEADGARLGKRGWELAERAIALDPRHVAGPYFAALAMGKHALGIGVLRALAAGIDGKFRGRLAAAERLDPRYDHDGIQVAWGTYYARLPWPKHDARKAEEHLRRALERNPASLRARVALADLRLRQGRGAEAARLLDQVAAARPGRYDAPEERRAQRMAAALRHQVPSPRAAGGSG